MYGEGVEALAFAMDKKIRQVATCRIFWLRWRDSPLAFCKTF